MEKTNDKMGELTNREVETLQELLGKLFATTGNSNIKSHARGILLKLVGLS